MMVWVVTAGVVINALTVWYLIKANRQLKRMDRALRALVSTTTMTMLASGGPTGPTMSAAQAYVASRARSDAARAKR